MQNVNVFSERNIKTLKGEKYSQWKFRIRALLSDLDVIKEIDENKPRKWRLINGRKQSGGVLVEQLVESISRFVKAYCSAKDILKSVDSIYDRKSFGDQLSNRKRMLYVKFQWDTALVKNFTKFTHLIQEMLAAGEKLEKADNTNCKSA